MHPGRRGNVPGCEARQRFTTDASRPDRRPAPGQNPGRGQPGGLLRLQLVTNHGAAFGLAARYEPVLSAAAAGIILLVTWALRASRGTERLGAVLAAGGAAGNLIDRLIRPPSVLHTWFYGPTFNLADVWLRVCLLIAAAGWLWQERAPGGSV